jgi:hypothetical protein
LKKSVLYQYSTDIKFLYSSDPITLSQEHRSIVDSHWSEKTNTNGHLFNGPVVSLGDITIGDIVKLQFNQTDYAHYLASESRILPDEACCRSLYVSALIETNDNQVAFAKMGELSFDPGRYQYIGGGIDKSHISGSSINLEKCIREELSEEIGIERNSVSTLEPIFLSMGLEKRKVSVIFHLKADLDTKGLYRCLNIHNAKLEQQGRVPEVEGFVFVNKDNYYRQCAKLMVIDENLFSSLHAFFTGKVEEDFSSIM